MGNEFWAYLLIAVLFGGVVEAFVFPHEVEVEKEVLVEVPVEVLVNVDVEKIVLVTPLDEAVTEFMKAVEHEEDEAGTDLEVFGGDYDFDEISIVKVDKDYSYVVSKNGDVTVVDFEIKLKARESGESSEREVYDVKVTYEDDEDTKVSAVLHSSSE